MTDDFFAALCIMCKYNADSNLLNQVIKLDKITAGRSRHLHVQDALQKTRYLLIVIYFLFTEDGAKHTFVGL